ncbi:hypothetical protein M4951_18495 [Blastopirellula sp. J2-11]|uniref:family 16 glycoside hydrolase n=1 Tax=Blastopirellula sp. J2-11 TaxID=2943192 RepID=UPI0021CA6500|nr:family 16 glycoside hydrolase [Blastopirellula sp. J2-11]UUO05359.1 hypothetical protein M4951_18495 [Blastopirellula sp. J2-11]
MLRVTTAAIGFLLFVSICGTLLAEEVSEPKGTLVLEDNFDREESSPQKEEVGNGWTTNSRARAKGNQQVDLVDGVMQVTRYPQANHGVAIFHDVDFQDAMVEMKFKLGPGDDLGLDFVDRELKTVHAGHLCIARVTLDRITLQDTKTGRMDLKIRERLQAGEKSPELMKFIRSKMIATPLELKPNQWCTLRVTVEGDTMTAAIDGKQVAHYSSEGIAHPTKRMITLAVNKSAWIDDLKVWKLK